jgi:hypothetical protein
MCSTAANGLVPEEEGIIDDASEDENERITDEILQEMTLEKFEHVSVTPLLRFLYHNGFY